MPQQPQQNEAFQYLDHREISNPLHVIHQWVWDIGLPHIREYIDTWVPAVFEAKTWSESQPCDLFWFYECLLKAFEAASIINRTEPNKVAIIEETQIRAEIDLFHPSLYCYSHEALQPWDYFPRYLTKKEFLDPYACLESVFRFLSLAQWKSELRDMLHQALSTESMKDYGEPIDLAGIQHHLNKFSEACQLLHARTYTYINGQPRRRQEALRVSHILLGKERSEN